MNKSVMNAIELLSIQYNFSVEDAVNILTMNNKKSRSKAKVVEPKKEVEDLFAQLVNDAEDVMPRNEIVLKPVPETMIVTYNTPSLDAPIKKPKKASPSAEEKEALAKQKSWKNRRQKSKRS